ncbi:hypothetical protein LJC57_06075 [Parabacteroides sp. OttesenSCG-928-G07]|nr:hypothetical protein [Parabacteroides sp. OttesenSCG-928-G07]
MKKLLIVYSLFFLPLLIYAQTNETRSLNQSTEINIFSQLLLYPQEKIHLHVDRDYYVPGEHIWFKTYLTHATTHQRFDGSRYVYVELINSSDSIVNQVMLRPDENGLHHGHIYLSEIVPEGYYTLRAYTKYMLTPEEDYIFKKLIRIGNLSAGEQFAKDNRSGKTRQSREDFDVAFFPEGGNLLEGVFNHVAFKGLNSRGYSEYILGEIVDEKGEFVVDFKTTHAGMGGFGFIPESGKTYYAVCQNTQGKSKRIKLPEAKNNIYSLTTSYWRDGKLTVGRLKSADVKRQDKMYLLLHCRGMLLHFGEWDNSKEYMVFTESQLPSGVIQIILFDQELNPLSERLVFSKSRDQGELQLSTEKSTYKMRELVKTDLLFTDTYGSLQAGDLSVSVIDDGDLPIDNSSTIFSTLLLSSDLKGYIENPGYYFEKDNDTTMLALDYLMMTQGWRRYAIPEVIKGNYAMAEIPFEQSMGVSGKVNRFVRSGGIKEGNVTLISLNDGNFLQVNTDEDGRFLFEKIEFPDSTKFLVRAEDAKGSEFVRLSVDELSVKAKALVYNENTPNEDIAKQLIERQESSHRFMEKAEERYKYDEDMRTIHLADIEVVAPKIERDSKFKSVYSIFAPNSLAGDAIAEFNPIKTEDVMIRLPGVFMGSGGEGILLSAMPGLVEPAIMVDDVFQPEDLSTAEILRLIHPEEIERIDVFKFHEAGIFGLQGKNGVVSITTKSGLSLNKETEQALNQKTITPLGYQSPVEFYSPRYETEEKRFDIKPDLRTTIYWKPDIITSEDGKASFDFYTADYTTTYSIVVEGLSEEGKVVRGVKLIEVK